MATVPTLISQVLYDKQGMLVINKPAGLVVQGGQHGPEAELVEILPLLRPDTSPVHRIDKHTSGILVSATGRRLRGYFMNNWHKITGKTYLAVIRNPLWVERVVSIPLDGLTCATSFRVLHRESSYALVVCEMLQNGRRHQIRRHLKSIGSPIVGDNLYNGERSTARAGQLLHAWKLKLTFPQQKDPESRYEISSRNEVIQASIPADVKSYFPNVNWSELDAGAWESVATIAQPDGWTRPAKAPKLKSEA